MLLLWQTGSTPSKVNVVLPTREAAAARHIGGESRFATGIRIQIKIMAHLYFDIRNSSVFLSIALYSSFIHHFSTNGK